MVWTTREIVILGLLVMSVPAQYWLISNFASSGGKPQQSLFKLGKEIDKLKLIWFETMYAWKRWIMVLVNALRGITGIGVGKVRSLSQECPAQEVFLFRERTGYFGLSPEVRPNRPGYISYRIGQVVKLVDHSDQGAMGIIIAWDLYARAPETWLNENYGEDSELRKEPHYRILLSRPLLRETYIAQRYLKVLRATQINHPRVTELFSHFDGAQYIPRSSLKRLYPLD